ncbi:MAG: hypothetical protein KF729_02270 [Sandaracinaceae bacterium]|nr:hypothetical protein [Sandaracinaceae bacterium]
MRRWGAAALALVIGLGCDDAGGALPEDPGLAVLRPRSAPIEHVGMSSSRAVGAEADALDVLGPLFGRDGRFHDAYVLEPGLRVTSAPDPRTPEQAVVTLAMDPADGGAARTILRVPVSLEYGRVFLETVRAALARAEELAANDPRAAQPWQLEYRVISPQGGALVARVSHDGAAADLTLETESPRTSLRRGEVNQPAFEGAPHEVIGGTVHFELSRDEFDFFTSRAYGVSHGREQNFSDFRLQPHDWLRLTVTPQIDDGVVDVAFEVVTREGGRVAFAHAPASYVAGEQFRQNVFRAVDNMLAREREAPGSARPFTVPFHYDDPVGGGVVRVIARGAGGVFRIAYAVDSPVHALRDTDFVPYVGDPLADTPPPPPPAATCAEHGSVAADEGRFALRFDASRTVRRSARLTHELRGAVYGSVYRAADVSIDGPRAGSSPVAELAFADVDVRAGISEQVYLLDTVLPAGEYQVLSFMDVDGNAGEAEEPSPGDPVSIPIGGYPLRCSVQPVVVEFALLLPEGL